MRSATATLDPGDVIAPLDRRLFGSFVEHMGRCVYTGIFEPAHAAADGDGFRADVLDLVRELGVTVVRYPGGNFVSGYRWEDGVGPREHRPARLDLAWHSRETNAFGLHEFMAWTRKAGLEPLMALNLGTRGVPEALDLLEYANHHDGSAHSDRRAAHGSAEPFGIRMWCLGNELDGPWQLGHKSAQEYARLACETARAMRQFDPSLYLVACGSSSAAMPTFGDWERTVLQEAYDLVDAISLHAYYEEGDDLASFLASGVDLERALGQVAAIADAVGADRGSARRIDLVVDEWNVWYLSRHLERFAPHDWPEAPPLCEDAYTLADAVVVGGLLIALLKHADRVALACLAQLVNAIAPIKTEPGGPAWREATFHPFALTAAHARGLVIRSSVDAPTVDTVRYGEVPAVDAVATLDVSGALSIFMVNRHLEEHVRMSIDLADTGAYRFAEGTVLTDPDRHARNLRSDPGRVQPQPLAATLDQPRLQTTLPPVSWAMLRLEQA